MRKRLIILCGLLFVFGCSRQPNDKIVLVKVNDYEVTLEEFEEEFKESVYAVTDTPESRKAFLENLINRKVILQDAQKQNLDKERDFLKSIQKFWEQSLLKAALDKKDKESALLVKIDDALIEQTYKNMAKEGKVDKAYEQMYNQIKWELGQIERFQILNEWIGGLRKKASIKINYELLKKQ